MQGGAKVQKARRDEMRARRQASVRRAQDPAPRAASPSCAHLDGREKVVHRRGWRPLECGARAECQRFFEYFPPEPGVLVNSAARDGPQLMIIDQPPAGDFPPLDRNRLWQKVMRVSCARAHSLARCPRTSRASAIGAPVAFRASGDRRACRLPSLGDRRACRLPSLGDRPMCR